MTNKKSILCYGDSLTWGWIPVEEGAPTCRYPYEQRWTGVMGGLLGSDFHVIEEGLSARTTSLDDPTDPRLNGSSYLPSALASHLPLDLVIIMLGTNDTKAFFHRSAFEIANGVSKLIGQVISCAGGVGTSYSAPKVLLVAPPPLGKLKHIWFQGTFEGGLEKTLELPKYYAALADFMNIEFLNAGDFITTDGVDGIHFTVENNAALGKVIMEKVKMIFS
ncbi:SGNH/GDSL hydrolase family protein [Marinomonas foliarum]|uniref:Lysophospholipase L1-like esterase n=1 Tax=Marinomonas foliarum TaxID=491950 RepID=A0A369AK72_9GAMM|nr:SGNH/GDSL hydrolase family protein [Marinomonas foliarum]RCX08748.1 lysophospholipase L1-like esterase [Marinomonas foliarum]